MSVKLFVMITQVSNNIPEKITFCNYTDDFDLAELKKSANDLGNYLKEIKKITTVTKAAPPGRVFNERVTAHTDYILAVHPLEDFKNKVHKINLVFQKDPVPLQEIFDIDTTRHRGRESIISELALSDQFKFITATDFSKAKNFSEIMPTKIFGETIDLLFSSLDYLLTLKDKSTTLLNGTKQMFDQLIDEISNTLSLCFKNLKRDQKYLVREFLSRSTIHSNLQAIMNGLTRNHEGIPLRDKILDLPSISANRVSKVSSSPRDKAKHKNETKPQQ